MSSCSRDYTVAYVYAVSASASGTISAYAVDYQTGILNQINGSPFSSTVSQPLKVVAHPSNQAIYIVGGPNGSQGNEVETALVGSDGKLYGQSSINLTGTLGPGSTNLPTPVGMAVDSTGTYLYVTFTYQNGYSSASPGPGGVTIFKIDQTNYGLTVVGTVNVGNNPVAVAVSAPVCVSTPIVSGNPGCTTGGSTGAYNTYVYVVDQEAALGKPTVLGFAQNMTSGTLTPLSGTTFNSTLKTYQGISAGVTPSAIAVDGTASYVYVTDQETNQIYGYSIARSTTGNLTALPSSPFATGALPLGVTIDPRAKYVYTANANAGSVSAFAINQSTGSLSAVAGSTFTTQAGTNCVTIDPNLGVYLYATNYVTNNISGGKLNASTGVVSAVANTPFPTGTLPSCLVAVGNGSHATSETFPVTGTTN
ncbi:MAG: beta-propeller fold lactonase family protein [Rhodospirillales bacterium]|nr:beta-propeller fold lactonase family protein [Acetobacter sp.]